MKKLSALSIFFPALNDGKILPYLISCAYKVAGEVANKFEIIVINDGSTDDTLEVLEALKIHYLDLRIISHKSNMGYGAALWEGFEASKMKYIFYTDGDGQYDPLELTKLVNRMTVGVDVVNGRQISRSDNWVRKLVGTVYNLFLHLIFKLPIEDVDCDFRLCRRSVLKNIQLTSSSGAICLEMVYKLAANGANFAEVEVSHYPRPYGLSEYFKVKNIVQTIKQLWQLYWDLHK